MADLELSRNVARALEKPALTIRLGVSGFSVLSLSLHFFIRNS